MKDEIRFLLGVDSEFVVLEELGLVFEERERVVGSHGIWGEVEV